MMRLSCLIFLGFQVDLKKNILTGILNVFHASVINFCSDLYMSLDHYNSRKKYEVLVIH
jgi:hypothetical protein